MSSIKDGGYLSSYEDATIVSLFEDGGGRYGDERLHDHELDQARGPHP